MGGETVSNEGIRILVVDDEPSVCLALEGVLSRQGYQVATAANGDEALKFMERLPVDLALLDLNMPGMDGIQLMGEIRRRWPRTQIMILTGYGTLETALTALRQGAHDYLLKPSSPHDIIASVERGLEERHKERRRQDLLSRIEADLSELRGEPAASTAGEPAVERAAEDQIRAVQVGSMEVDLRRHTVAFDGQPLDLTPTEFRVLVSLMRRAGKVVTGATLVREAQGHECTEREARTLVKTHISHLRKKIHAVSPGSNPIVNVRGVGYLYSEEEENID
jgi:DNA-binding response OmpR family regulator